MNPRWVRLMLRILLFETPEDPRMNLAFEEAFVRVRAHNYIDDTLRIWRNRNAVVIGYFQRMGEEVDMGSASEYNVEVVRRFTGGGAVYHDLGNINYAIVTSGVGRDLAYVFKYLINGLVYALNKIGLEARLENINDVVVGSYKISGTAASLRWGVYFLHGSILFNTDLNLLYSVLKVPKIKLIDKGVSDVKYRVKNIIDILGRDIRYSEIVDALAYGFSKLLGKEYYFDMPSKLEYEVARALYDLRYSREKWNEGYLRFIDMKDVDEYIEEILSK